MKCLAMAAAILGAIARPAHAQSSPELITSTGPPVVITGRVVDASSGQAIRNARVAVTSPPQERGVALTDAEGLFSLPAPPGRYTVAISKTGYATREAAPANAAVPLDVIRLERGVVIAGRVVDEFGDPVVGARVAASTHDGPAGESVVATAYTDDRGHYRLAGLRAAPLAVAVTTVEASATTYYPGVTEQKEALRLRLRPGEEAPGVDFVVPADRRSFARTMGFAGWIIVSATPSPLSEERPEVRATGIVRGRITTTDGLPVPHARVVLFSSGRVDSPPAEDRLLIARRPSRETTADDDGRYEFRELAAGRLRITASKTGYSPVEDGQSVSFAPRAAPAGGRLIELKDGETHQRVDVTLTRWGTLTGRVYDEYGDPVQGASVQALQVRYEAGRRQLVAAGVTRLTDDLGEYRVFGLAPGHYAVSAVVRDVSSADLPGYPRSYFPGTSNAGEARFVPVGPSQDVGPVDLRLERGRTARIAGRVFNAAGEPTAAGSLLLIQSQRSGWATSPPVGARISNDGSFEFPNTAPGRYVIKAERNRPNSYTEGELTALPVTVDAADVTGLVLHTSAGSTIRGRFTFDAFDQSQTPSPAEIELSPVPVDSDAAPSAVASAKIHADWTFEMSGINGPRRLGLLRVPRGWSLKQVRINGFDVTDRPLPFGRPGESQTDVEIVLTDRITSLTGTVVDDRGRPDPGSAAMVFSVDRTHWYSKSRFVRKADIGAGGFKVEGLPPGEYYVAAVARVAADGDDASQEPAFLESLIGGASSVTLDEGQQATVALRLPARR
jgi:protocatechuate 3,4-dioxygenase beta subunit